MRHQSQKVNDLRKFLSNFSQNMKYFSQHSYNLSENFEDSCQYLRDFGKKLYNIRAYLHWGHENFTYFLQHRSIATVIVATIFTRVHLSRVSIGDVFKAKMPTIARRGSHYCICLGRATLGGATQIGSFISIGYGKYNSGYCMLLLRIFSRTNFANVHEP
jgi:hypothetical protein